MRARGKRRAQRGASPLDQNVKDHEALKERNTGEGISHFQCSTLIIFYQGRRSSLRSSLAPGCSYFAPLALRTQNSECQKPVKTTTAETGGRIHLQFDFTRLPITTTNAK
jgi:hypothetical protein